MNFFKNESVNMLVNEFLSRGDELNDEFIKAFALLDRIEDAEYASGEYSELMNKYASLSYEVIEHIEDLELTLAYCE